MAHGGGGLPEALPPDACCGTPVCAAVGSVSPQRLIPRRRWGAAPPRRGCQAAASDHGGAPPYPPEASLRSCRKVAVLALQPGRLPPAAGGALFRRFGPRPPCAVAVLGLRPGTASAACARRPRSHLPPGAPTDTNPSPARRNTSLAHWWAPPGKAKPCGWLEDSPALPAPTNALANLPPPGRKTGWGKNQGQAHGVLASVALPLVAMIPHPRRASA